MIGIIGAMNEEIIELKSLMKDIEEVKLASFTYFKGILEEKEIVPRDISAIASTLFSIEEINSFEYSSISDFLLFLLLHV